MTQLSPLRAPEHRAFIGPEFGAGEDGPDPQTLSYVQIMGTPKLAVLARRVWEELREQFAQPDDAASMAAASPEAEEYRTKLEGWADMLEILLEETLAELEAINTQRAGPGAEF